MKHILLWLSFLTVLFPALRLDARTFSIAEKVAFPGNEVVFPIQLDDATGFASIQIQINYDLQILDYLSFDTGTGLGSQYSPTAIAEDGVLTLIWTRPIALISGSGTLGLIKFRVNPGADIGALTPLTLSNHETSDETGVLEFSLGESIHAISGSLTVSTTQPDADNDGMPDAWEIEHTLSPLTSSGNTDTDHDGRSDFLEYAFGGNPRLSDAGRSPQAGSASSSGADFLTLTFHRRRDTSLLYRVWESANLGNWTEVDVPSRLLQLPENQSDGTERVTVRSSFQNSGLGASPNGFMKVEVLKP